MIISFCHNTCIWQTDGQTEQRQQYRALHYMQSHGTKPSVGCHYFQQACHYLPSHRASASFGWYQIMLLGDKNNLLGGMTGRKTVIKPVDQETNVLTITSQHCTQSSVTIIHRWMGNWSKQGISHKMHAVWTQIKWIQLSMLHKVHLPDRNQRYIPRCIIRRECMWSRALQIWMKYFQTVLSGIRRSCFLKCCDHTPTTNNRQSIVRTEVTGK